MSQSTAKATIDAVREKFQESEFSELRKVSVSSNAHLLRIAGTVSSYYMKAMAGATAIAVRGVLQLENDVVVL